MDWSRARPLLERLMALPEDQRLEALERECADDPKLGRRLRALLAAGRDRDGFLEAPSPHAMNRHPTALAPGDAIGSWSLVRELGAGGMGSVWLADRDGADFRQRVAIKVVKRGMDTDAVLRRFRRERRVLADLDHPNVPHFVDGGATQDGRPYLVMEYVDGLPIDAFARERELDLRARVELLLEVCEVVQHAHECGIVHRDLKPSNVLVTASGTPKLCDFGIAKVLAQDDALGTLDLTLTGQQLLTPRYASPEQFRGEPVGPATDVYALGLLLWELCVDAPALELDALTRADLEEAICERPIPRPSRAVDASRTDLRRQLDGDLDTICQMALRKEPERRYASARQLGDDLRRYLEGRRVLARPDTITYRTTRFVRRNRALVTGGVSTILLLAIGLIVAFFLYREAVLEREHSERVSYTANLDAAAAELRAGRVAPAEARLAEAPEHLRGWEWRHLQARLDQSLFTVPFTGQGWHDVALAPDGESFAVAVAASLHVFEGPSELFSLRAYPCGLTWSSDGASVAWCDTGGNVWRVDVALGLDSRRSLLQGEEPRWTGLEPELAVDVAWRPKADQVAYFASDGTVTLLEAETGETRAQWHAHAPSHLGALAWSPEGSLLASGGWDETVQLYDAESGQHLGGWRAHTMVVNDLDFAPAGDLLATVSLDGALKVWDVETRELVSVVQDAHATAVRFVDDGKRLALGCNLGSLKIHDRSLGRDVRSLSGHQTQVIALDVDRDRTRAVTIDTGRDLGSGSLVKVWDLRGEAVRTARTCEFTNTIRPDSSGTRFATASPDGLVRVWSLDEPTIRVLSTLDAECGMALGVDWDPSGSKLAAAYEHGVVLWDLAQPESPRRLHEEFAFDVAYTPSGRRFVCLQGEPSLEGHSVARSYDARSGELVGETLVPIPAYKRGVIAFRSDDSLAVTLALHKGICRFNGSQVEPVPGKFAGVLLLPGRGLELLAESKRCTLRDDSGKLLREWDTSESILCLAQSPDETRIAIGGVTGIELWDPHEPRRVVSLQGTGRTVYDLAWTPDGETLLSVDEGGWIHAYETRSVAER